ncbi:hypothetical protein Catovirus_1_606 [Catovirus CTV1]|uniref:Uncharacterized protein n=1 Tax=Catovirus CTV1 TaxID=1977631 RepID=A0A1V0SA15_9VIRU|nr:hypothetical protein Catovirus_1_606 [Catovirus CTV1]
MSEIILYYRIVVKNNGYKVYCDNLTKKNLDDCLTIVDHKLSEKLGDSEIKEAKKNVVSHKSSV